MINFEKLYASIQITWVNDRTGTELVTRTERTVFNFPFVLDNLVDTAIDASGENESLRNIEIREGDPHRYMI